MGGPARVVLLNGAGSAGKSSIARALQAIAGRPLLHVQMDAFFDMLPPAWRAVSLFNPVVFLISGFRWSFYGTSDVGVGLSLAMTLGFFLACLAAVTWVFRTGYRLKS